MSKPRRAGYARDLADVVARVAGDYARDKRLCIAVAVGFTGLAAYAHYMTSQPAIAEQFHLVHEEARARSKAKRERRNHRTGSNVSTIASSAARNGTPSSSAPASDNEDSKHGVGDGGKALAEAKVAAPKRKVAAVDATFLKANYRGRFVFLARELGVPFSILALDAPAEVLEARIARRQAEASDASEATVDVLRGQLDELEPLAGEERAYAVQVSGETVGDLEALTRHLLRKRSAPLARRLEAPADDER